MSSDEDRTAYDRNIEEVIYQLELEDDATYILQWTHGLDRDEMRCRDCGDLALWWVSEIRTEAGYEEGDRGRVNSFYCNDCIPEPFVELWAYWPWTDPGALDRDVDAGDVDDADDESSPDVLTDGGQTVAEDRMEWFSREIETFTDHKAEPDRAEVVVSIVEPGDRFTIDLEPIVDAGLSYGLIMVDGLVGTNTAELRFKPSEDIEPAYHELQDEPSGESFPHIPPVMSQRTYYALVRVWQRWEVLPFDAEDFLNEVGFFDASNGGEQGE